MKTQLCCFSGFRIQPGFGARFIRGDMKTFIFFSSKTASWFFKKRNPRKCPWTVAYRLVHKKGHAEETVKRRARRVVRHEVHYSGITADEIHARRTQKPEVRKAAREAAARELKERNKVLKEKKVAARKEKKTEKVSAPKQKVANRSVKGSAKGR